VLGLLLPPAHAEESFRLTRPGAAPGSTQSSSDSDAPASGPVHNDGSAPLQVHVSKSEAAGGADDNANAGTALNGRTDANSGTALKGGADTNSGTPLKGQAGNSAPVPLQLEKHPTSLIKLSASDLETIQQHDIVLCIDKSSSMSTMDCPSMVHRGYTVSRWQWCGEQTLDLADQASAVLPEGMSVVLFSWVATPFPHVDAKQIPMIFMGNRPDGITNAGMALKIVLEDYFNRKQANPTKVRPMIVAIITDGLPTNPFDVKDAIFRATEMMKSPDEIHFTFLQIGRDPEGIEFIRTLDRDLLGHGAKYDVVSGKTFDQLQRTGLAKAIVEAVAPKTVSKKDK
jgi:hypothetical protein